MQNIYLVLTEALIDEIRKKRHGMADFLKRKKYRRRGY